jgi:hypothetical protein
MTKNKKYNNNSFSPSKNQSDTRHQINSNHSKNGFKKSELTRQVLSKRKEFGKYKDLNDPNRTTLNPLSTTAFFNLIAATVKQNQESILTYDQQKLIDEFLKNIEEKIEDNKELGAFEQRTEQRKSGEFSPCFSQLERDFINLKFCDLIKNYGLICRDLNTIPERFTDLQKFILLLLGKLSADYAKQNDYEKSWAIQSFIKNLISSNPDILTDIIIDKEMIENLKKQLDLYKKPNISVKEILSDNKCHIFNVKTNGVNIKFNEMILGPKEETGQCPYENSCFGDFIKNDIFGHNIKEPVKTKIDESKDESKKETTKSIILSVLSTKTKPFSLPTIKEGAQGWPKSSKKNPENSTANYKDSNYSVLNYTKSFNNSDGNFVYQKSIANDTNGLNGTQIRFLSNKNNNLVGLGILIGLSISGFCIAAFTVTVGRLFHKKYCNKNPNNYEPVNTAIKLKTINKNKDKNKTLNDLDNQLLP